MDASPCHVQRAGIREAVSDLAGDEEAIKQRALELAQFKYIKSFDKAIAARNSAASVATVLVG